MQTIRRRLRPAVGYAVAIVPLVIASSSLLVPGWEGKRFVLFYVAPLFLAFVAWLWLRLGDLQPNMSAVLMLDLIVVATAGLRFLTGLLPASGHMVFLVYSGATQRAGWYRLLAGVLVAETSYFKLVIWHDTRSWLLGGFAGFAAAAVHLFACRMDGERTNLSDAQISTTRIGES